MRLTWTRRIERCDSLGDFLWRKQCGDFDDDDDFQPIHPKWEKRCLGNGWDPNPLLVGPGGFRKSKSVTVTGEIRDGKGHHPSATFVHQ